MDAPNRSLGLGLLLSGLIVVAYNFWRHGLSLGSVAGSLWFGLAAAALAAGLTILMWNDTTTWADGLIATTALMTIASLFALVGSGLSIFFWLWAVIAIVCFVIAMLMRRQGSRPSANR